MSTHTAASPLLKVLSFALLPALAMLIGGVVATFRAPNAVWRSAILHFAAGVVFSVVAVELLPDIVREHRPLEVALGFGGGVAAMLGVCALASRLEGEEKPAVTSPHDGVATRALPVGLLFGVAVDLAVDGLLLGIGFAAGQKEGVLLALALTVEILALGLATAAQLGRGARQDNRHHRRVRRIVLSQRVRRRDALARLEGRGAGIGLVVRAGRAVVSRHRRIVSGSSRSRRNAAFNRVVFRRLLTFPAVGDERINA